MAEEVAAALRLKLAEQQAVVRADPSDFAARQALITTAEKLARSLCLALKRRKALAPRPRPRRAARAP